MIMIEEGGIRALEADHEEPSSQLVGRIQALKLSKNSCPKLSFDELSSD
jgi:hypothetical protein